MDLWGFTDKKFRLPKDDEIKKTINLVGSDKIILQEENNVVEFKNLGMKIDLGAIAKGYAIDSAINKLKINGVKSCLINAGGDLFCLGDKLGKPWNIAIQNPRLPSFLGYLKLKDRAVATSGDYEQYFIQDNRRYAHILNPKSGYPADSGVVSVTVLASDCLTADALATAIFVLGKIKGEELAKKILGVEVKIIEENDKKNYVHNLTGGKTTSCNLLWY
jgi:thiamine biosynthesis lipoprotein